MEFSRTGLREDVTLMMLANTLKEVAADYDVFIFSGTQVNRDWEKRQFRNENNIAGSKAIADKADIGVIATKLTEEEKEEIGTLLKEIDANAEIIVGCQNICGICRTKPFTIVNGMPIIASTEDELISKIKEKAKK